MAFSFGFFNSDDSDPSLERLYTAEDFSNYLKGIIRNGCVPLDASSPVNDGLKVVPDSQLLGASPSVIISPGKAFYNGLWFINDTDYVLELDSYAPGNKALIVLCFDTNTNQKTVYFQYVVDENPVLPSGVPGQYFMPIGVVTYTGVQPVANDIDDRVRQYAGVYGVGLDTQSIEDGAITNIKLAGGITYNKLAGDIRGTQLRAATIGNDRLAGSITYDKLAGDIRGTQLRAATIGNDRLAGGITSDKLAADSVITSKVEDGAITSPKMDFSGLVLETTISSDDESLQSDQEIGDTGMRMTIDNSNKTYGHSAILCATIQVSGPSVDGTSTLVYGRIKKSVDGGAWTSIKSNVITVEQGDYATLNVNAVDYAAPQESTRYTLFAESSDEAITVTTATNMVGIFLPNY